MKKKPINVRKGDSYNGLSEEEKKRRSAVIQSQWDAAGNSQSPVSFNTPNISYTNAVPSSAVNYYSPGSSPVSSSPTLVNNPISGQSQNTKGQNPNVSINKV